MEIKEIWVLLNKGDVYMDKYFPNEKSARNFVKMRNPGKKWREVSTNQIECKLTGMKFIIKPISCYSQIEENSHIIDTDESQEL